MNLSREFSQKQLSRPVFPTMLSLDSSYDSFHSLHRIFAVLTQFLEIGPMEGNRVLQLGVTLNQTVLQHAADYV